MSQEIQEPPSLPCWIVTAANCSAEITLDEYNSKFPPLDQMYESATIFLEVFLNISNREIPIIQNPESRDESAAIASTVLVHQKGGNPDWAVPIEVYVCLANAGLYAKSAESKKKLDADIAEYKKAHDEQQKNDTKLAEDLKNFNNLKKEVDSKIKKPKKKKT